MEKNFKRTTVTSALPYANGPRPYRPFGRCICTGRHLCPLSATEKRRCTFHRRFRRTWGTHHHPCQKGRYHPQDVVDRYHFLIKKSFEEFGISFDVYSRTSSKTHHELASDFFKKLYEKGEFIEKTSEQYYDEEAHQFLADRYITGECPHCHSEGAYGDQCEKCGTSLSPTDLINRKVPSAEANRS